MPFSKTITVIDRGIKFDTEEHRIRRIIKLHTKHHRELWSSLRPPRVNWGHLCRLNPRGEHAAWEIVLAAGIVSHTEHGNIKVIYDSQDISPVILELKAFFINLSDAHMYADLQIPRSHRSLVTFIKNDGAIAPLPGIFLGQVAH